MTSTQYIIQIPKPCKEDWEQMLPEEKGRFCWHCAKSVIDFTQLSDEQVVALLNRSEGKLCGRFSSLQLNRVVSEEPLRKASRSRMREIFAALLLLLTAREATARNAINPKISVTQTPTNNRLNADKDSMHLIEVTGVMLDSVTSEPLIGAVVQNKRNGVELLSDADGNFSIRALIGDTLTFKYLGYYNLDFIVHDAKFQQHRLQSNEKSITDKEIIVNGGAIVTTTLRITPIGRIRYFFHTGKIYRKGR